MRGRTPECSTPCFWCVYSNSVAHVTKCCGHGVLASVGVLGPKVHTSHVLLWLSVFISEGHVNLLCMFWETWPVFLHDCCTLQLVIFNLFTAELFYGQSSLPAGSFFFFLYCFVGCKLYASTLQCCAGHVNALFRITFPIKKTCTGCKK